MKKKKKNRETFSFFLQRLLIVVCCFISWSTKSPRVQRLTFKSGSLYISLFCMSRVNIIVNIVEPRAKRTTAYRKQGWEVKLWNMWVLSSVNIVVTGRNYFWSTVNQLWIWLAVSLLTYLGFMHGLEHVNKMSHVFIFYRLDFKNHHPNSVLI